MKVDNDDDLSLSSLMREDRDIQLILSIDSDSSDFKNFNLAGVAKNRSEGVDSQRAGDSPEEFQDETGPESR